MAERLVEIPVYRSVRDKIRELKKGQSYSEYLFSLAENSEGQDLRSQSSDEPPLGDSNG